MKEEEERRMVQAEAERREAEQVAREEESQRRRKEAEAKRREAERLGKEERDREAAAAEKEAATTQAVKRDEVDEGVRQRDGAPTRSPVNSLVAAASLRVPLAEPQQVMAALAALFQRSKEQEEAAREVKQQLARQEEEDGNLRAELAKVRKDLQESRERGAGVAQLELDLENTKQELKVSRQASQQALSAKLQEQEAGKQEHARLLAEKHALEESRKTAQEEKRAAEIVAQEAEERRVKVEQEKKELEATQKEQVRVAKQREREQRELESALQSKLEAVTEQLRAAEARARPPASAQPQPDSDKSRKRKQPDDAPDAPELGGGAGRSNASRLGSAGLSGEQVKIKVDKQSEQIAAQLRPHQQLRGAVAKLFQGSDNSNRLDPASFAQGECWPGEQQVRCIATWTEAAAWPIHACAFE